MLQSIPKKGILQVTTVTFSTEDVHWDLNWCMKVGVNERPLYSVWGTVIARQKHYISAVYLAQLPFTIWPLHLCKWYYSNIF